MTPRTVGRCPTTDQVATWPDSMLEAFLKFGELAVAKPYVLDRLRAEKFARETLTPGGAK